MKLSELRKLSKQKVLLKGKSARGKTLAACETSGKIAAEGKKVLYIDTESEGSITFVDLIEKGVIPEDALENIEYEQVDNFDRLLALLSHDNQSRYDLVVVDTLDHKHTLSLSNVVGEYNPSEADWNVYPEIYNGEKRIMTLIGKPKTNFLCTLDPDSGSVDKAKGVQTNVHGYFTAVVKLTKDGEDQWGSIVKNYVGKPDLIGKGLHGKNGFSENLANLMLEHME